MPKPSHKTAPDQPLQSVHRAHPLLRNGLLARNTLLNLAGYGAPLLVALATLPILVPRLGVERFGVLTLAWVFIGYLGLFDLGLSRALTKLVAEKIGSGDEAAIPGLIWTALALMAGMGVLIGGSMALLSPLLIARLMTPPPELAAEITQTFVILSLSVPVVIVSIGLRGVLDAWQRFDLANAVRVPLGIFVFVAPLLVIPFTLNLAVIISVLMGGRALALWVQYRFCCRLVPALRQGFVFERLQVKPLLHFGGWMTVTNIISPLMLHSDRFFISALFSLTAVTFYATPHEIVTKLFLIPSAIMGVFFPAFATSFVQARRHTAVLFDQSLRLIGLAMFPVCFITVLFAAEGLHLWMGAEFAAQSTAVLKWLTIGIFIFCLSQAPYSLLQGMGRPDVTAKLHLLEFPFFILLMSWMTANHGIVGSAMAWCLRMGLDAVGLFVLGRALLPETGPFYKKAAALSLVCLILLGSAALADTLATKALLALVALPAWGLGGWFVVLTREERLKVKGER